MRSSKYCRVVKELQEGLKIPLKKANTTIKGSTFNGDFAKQAIKDHSNTTKGLRRGRALICNRRLKRAGTLVDKKTSYKKLTPKYLVYGIQGHSL